MSNGFEEAQGQRNLLERLIEKIPGFRGFQDRELRRDVDKLQREHLAERLTHVKVRVRDRARSYTDAGQIGVLSPFDRLEKRLEGLSQKIRFSDYGATGLFDAVKIYEPELERLYQFDLSVLEDVDDVARLVEKIPAPGGDNPEPAVQRALDRVGELERKWAGRGDVISSVVETG